jgi:hypothetical protein
VSEDRHDHFGSGTSFGKTPASRLSQPMWLTIKRKSGASDRVAHPLAETIDREWLSVHGCDDRNVLALCRDQRSEQVAMEWDQ